MMKNKFIFQWIGTAILSFLLALLLVWSVPAVFLKQKAGNPNSWLHYYYNYKNAVTSKESPIEAANPAIVIIDAHDASMGSRNAIGALIERVDSLRPLAIGMDIIYAERTADSPALDEAITRAFESCSSPLVVAARAEDAVVSDTLEHSFFTKPAGLEYGTINAGDIYRFEPYDVVAGDTIPKMVYLLAKESGLMCSGNISGRVVNYNSRKIRVLNSLDQLTPETVSGRIVLIGDTRDKRDFVDLPFRIEGTSRTSGVVLNAYMLASLIEPDNSFHRIGFGYSLLLSLLLILIFSAGFTYLSNLLLAVFKPENVNNNWRFAFSTLYLIVRPFLLVLLEFCAVAIAFLYLDWFHKIPDLWVFMVAIAVAGSVRSFVIMVHKRIQK